MPEGQPCRPRRTFGQCITQAISKATGALVPFPNPFGVTGTVPAFSPQIQGNIRARYDWDDGRLQGLCAGRRELYRASMFNQPATYTSGAGVLVPNTTFLRY